jgi:hypothetical protein
MRTTITLTPEAEALVHGAMAERGMSFKDVVNTAIVQGLAPAERPAFKTKTYAIGLAPIPGDKALALAADLEDEELLRKMDMGK